MRHSQRETGNHSPDTKRDIVIYYQVFPIPVSPCEVRAVHWYMRVSWPEYIEGLKRLIASLQNAVERNTYFERFKYTEKSINHEGTSISFGYNCKFTKSKSFLKSEFLIL